MTKNNLITATTSECSTFWKAGPLLVLVTSPQPMKPHLIIFSLIIYTYCVCLNKPQR